MERWKVNQPCILLITHQTEYLHVDGFPNGLGQSFQPISIYLLCLIYLIYWILGSLARRGDGSVNLQKRKFETSKWEIQPAGNGETRNMCRAVVSLACLLHHLTLFTHEICLDIFFNSDCVDDGWFKHPHLARISLIGLWCWGGAVHLLHMKQSVCTG